MPALEDVGGRIELDRERIDFARLHENFFLERLAKASSLDAVGDVQVEAAGKIAAGRIDVDQLGGEVGIDGRGGDPQLDRKLAGHFGIDGQRFGLKHENIV